MRQVIPFMTAVLIVCTPIEAKEYSIGLQHETKMTSASVIDGPAPEIPAEFKETAFKTSVIARFKILKDGKSTVELLSSSGNEDIDRIVTDTLKKWKFKPATLDHLPCESTKKLRVDLEIE